MGDNTPTATLTEHLLNGPAPVVTGGKRGRSAAPSWIYCITDETESIVKVGSSIDPARRLTQLSRCCKAAQACRAHLALPVATRRGGVLRLARVWRVDDTRSSAYVLEGAIHWELGTRGFFAAGEWYAASPATVEPIITAVAKELLRIWRRHAKREKASA